MHIAKANFSRQGFELEGEGASAYDASLGLKHYLRTIRLSERDGLSVVDTLESSAARKFTEVLHSDQEITEKSKNKFVFTVNGAQLGVGLSATPDAETKIESNVVMGPGKPGSVDKGTQEERGKRLLVTTPAPTEKTTFNWALSF